MTEEQKLCRHSEVWSGDEAWCSFCGLDMRNDEILELPVADIQQGRQGLAG